MSTKIVYPGTFDPLTNGHLDLIQQAAKLFDRVIVAIAESIDKRPLFTLDERVLLAKSVTSHLPNVCVVSFSGLLIHCLKQHQATLLLRGLRNSKDFEYELPLAFINRCQMSSLQTLFLLPAPEWLFLSSSLIKEIACRGGEVEPFLPAVVAAALSTKVRQS